MIEKKPRLNKSFARRIGKTLSKTQKHLLENDLTQYTLEPSNLSDLLDYIAEIGTGMGEHFVQRASQNPNMMHIAFEPYLNGVANILKLMKSDNVTNILLWPDDMDEVFDKIPDNFLRALYILFPDPWPKKSHHKRRIINESRIKLFAKKMRKESKLYFVTDIEHYFNSAKDMILSTKLFLEDKESYKQYAGYTKTKYHKKAEIEGREVQYLSLSKL
jgi:release factor glutamine methyltransferase